LYLLISVCDILPSIPGGATSDQDDTFQYLDGDVISYVCIDPLFGIDGGEMTVCDSQGMWNPNPVPDCMRVCECHLF